LIQLASAILGQACPVGEIVTVPMSNERADLSTTRALSDKADRSNPTLVRRKTSVNYGS
jgi:hypothetical protein